MKWVARVGGQVIGPLNRETLADMARAGTLRGVDLRDLGTDGPWIPAGDTEFGALMPPSAAAPPGTARVGGFAAPGLPAAGLADAVAWWRRVTGQRAGRWATIVLVVAGVLLVVGAGLGGVYLRQQSDEAREKDAARSAAIRRAVMSQGSTVPPAAPRRPNPDAEAADAAAMIRAYWPHADAARSAHFSTAGCMDRTVGFDNILKCFRDAKQGADAALQAIPRETTPEPTSACGREIAEGNRRAIEAFARLQTDTLAFLQANRSRLAPLTAAKPLHEVCYDVLGGCGIPVWGDAAHPSADFSAGLSDIECTKRVFRCGPPDNVCFINKVASRLGLGPDKDPGGGVHSRVTGRPVR